MKIKTSELTGAALDWAVAQIEGHRVRWYGSPIYCAYVPKGKRSDYKWQPSLNWKQGGPLLERFFVVTGNATYGDGSIFEDICYGIIGENPDSGEHLHREFGPNRLVAGMRCIVASELGDEVDVPEELAPKRP